MNGKIIHGDCLEELKKLEDKSIDLILTDPPYGIGIAKKGTVGGGLLAKPKFYGNIDWDNSIPSEEIFLQMMRVSKNQIIFGGNYFTKYLSPSPCWLVWDKGRSGINFADVELVWSSFSSPARKFKWVWDGMRQEKMNKKEIRFHPTQKPVGLIEQILLSYSKEGDLVCDPFLGSGTTAIACEKLNRKYIGIEINEEYIKIAQQRLNAFKGQTRL